jgi:hypothetical protein
MKQAASRRDFLGAAASGAALSSLAALTAGQPARADDDTASADALEDQSASARGEGIPTYTAVFPHHWELTRLRSQQEHERVAASLLEADARPLTVAAYQMANHCGGAAGKEANLARMLRRPRACRSWLSLN